MERFSFGRGSSGSVEKDGAGDGAGDGPLGAAEDAEDDCPGDWSNWGD